MTALKPRGKADRRRDHHDYDDFMVNLPPSHRDAARPMKPHLHTRIKDIALFENMVMETECTEIGNLVQTAIGQGMADAKTLTRDDLAAIPTTLDESYARAIEVLDCVQHDFAGPHLLPYGCFLRHYEATLGGQADPGRLPFAEQKRVMERVKDIDPRKIERAWVLAINHPDDYEGGEIYFPTKKTALKLAQGTGVIFNPRLPYGVAPVTKGARRFFAGWATKFNPKWEGLASHGWR